jgi:hypothetical protein
VPVFVTCIVVREAFLSNHFLMFTPSFSTGPRGYSAICGVYWVTDGTDRCLVGRVGDEFKTFFKRLEGRLAQVVDIFPCSNEPKKLEYSSKRYGVCHVMLIDRFVEGDMAMMDYLDLVEESFATSDDDSSSAEGSGILRQRQHQSQKKL